MLKAAQVTSTARAVAAAPAGPGYGAEWRRGFLAIVPLWTGVVPFGATFGVIARQAGFGPLEAQLGPPHGDDPSEGLAQPLVPRRFVTVR